jgi:hypothetical protein
LNVEILQITIYFIDPEHLEMFMYYHLLVGKPHEH